MPRRATATRLARFSKAATIGLILAFALEADRAPFGILLGALVALALSATVVGHWSRRRAPRTQGRVLLRTPGGVAFATIVAVAAGSLVALVAALLLAAAAPSLVGDGSVAVRVLVALFATWSCLAVGSRCGRWWAFAGATALAPLLGFVMLVDGRTPAGGIGFVAVAVLVCSLPLAVGSLSQDLASSSREARRRKSGATTPAGLVVAPRRDRRAAMRGG